MERSILVRSYRASSRFLLSGIVFSLITPVFYSLVSQKGMWLVGSGLCMFILGFLNLAAGRLRFPWFLSMALLANLTVLVWFVLFVFILKDTLVIAAILPLIFVSISCWLVRRKNLRNIMNKS